MIPALIGHSHRWPLHLWDRTRDRPVSKTVVVEPGQQRVLFEFPLAEILPRQDPNTVRQDFQAGRRVLVWDWPAMPAPPPSPIYVGRDGELVDKSVYIRLSGDTKRLQAAPVRCRDWFAPPTSCQALCWLDKMRCESALSRLGTHSLWRNLR